MTPIAILEKARDLLAKGWCQNHMAQSRTRVTVSPHQAHAVRFCMMGALIHAEPTFNSPAREEARIALVQSVRLRYRKHAGITEYNDHSERTLQEVIECFDGAIDIVNNRSKGNYEQDSLRPPSQDELQLRYDAIRAKYGIDGLQR